MKLIENPAALKRFRRIAWKFQQTFETPLKDLKRFVSTVVKQLARGDRQVQPSSLSCLNANSITPRCQRGVSIIADEQEEIEALVGAALGDWVEFSVVPEPKIVCIYADHDEFTTFFVQNRSNLNRVVQAVSGQGFKLEKEYRREL